MMRDRAPRPEPVIPDHEVLRLVGGGSYGEVWLASGVTGAMRAVKVVRREDFDDERTFEREFEGILKYEPLSRDHPGLVHILHIGRSVDINDNPFYYYVMELGDDIYSGTAINPVEYEARNLLTDMKQSGDTPHDPDEVITIGLSLAEALTFLHEKGLVHRDIKPSNVIFVDGKAKLADIGLVASRGQRTFVGTEGFVPPEGPGSAQSDVYGLGKVLYEMATGRDRLDFPELPDKLPVVSHKKRWQGLNQLICDVCEPRVSKRQIKTAADLADGLKRLQTGRRLKRRRDAVLIKAIPIALISILSIWLLAPLVKSMLERSFTGDDVKTKSPQYGSLKVLSSPSGAEVYNANGEFLAVTPMKNIKMKVGSTRTFEFRLDGYRTAQETITLASDQARVLDHVMVVYSPPVEGQDWVDPIGAAYKPEGKHHISKHYVGNARWKRYVKSLKVKKSSEIITQKIDGSANYVALVTEDEAANYAKWLSETARAKGYLNDVQGVYSIVDKSAVTMKIDKRAKKQGRYPFKTVVKKIPLGRLEILSEPPGASVYINDEFIDYTPVYQNRIEAGEVTVTLIYDGYHKVTKSINVKEGAGERINEILRPNNSVVFGEKWKNSFGMKFIPIDGEDTLLVSIWETRISDFRKSGLELNVSKSKLTKQEGDHPALGISRLQAEQFCEILTKQEQEKEAIPQNAHYRLLTDLEWSRIAGVSEDASKTPAERELGNAAVFVWQGEWITQRPSMLVGNLAGEEFSDASFTTTVKTIPDYNDGYTQSSPVGSFPPNALGFYDLAGNVEEWVSDDYTSSSDYGILRGGSWKTYSKEHLYVGHRNVMKSSEKDLHFGFRILLEKLKTNQASVIK
ncbi:SUMF1/EgtB/PvdO family nonheme iron enzyme [Akkermansiaceae bacterium]|nr:SUMF1/EgtB/PvdO family nonheme iron enzyme [Akkermansiaceae bacterium]